MDRKEFKEALMLYGASLSLWPKAAGDEARELLKSAGDGAEELNALIEEEREFESLLSERSFQEPNEYLAQRIIANAEDNLSAARADGFWTGLFVDIFTPKRSFALVLILVIGFMVGYMDRPGSYDLVDSDEFIEESFVDLLMEDDIFEL